jgi:hypothetical protein
MTQENNKGFLIEAFYKNANFKSIDEVKEKN